jgi:hypothetical protein
MSAAAVRRLEASLRKLEEKLVWCEARLGVRVAWVYFGGFHLRDSEAEGKLVLEVGVPCCGF